MQVYIVHEPMIEAFERWVASQGWHLQGPFTFFEGDTPTHFLQPLPSEAALSAYLRLRQEDAVAHFTVRDDGAIEQNLPLSRTEAGHPRCATCEGGGCPDCTDPA